MNASDAASEKDQPGGAAHAGDHSSGPMSTPAAPSATPPTLLLAGLVAAGLVAGAISWAVDESQLNHFRPSAKSQSNRFEFAALTREEGFATQKNTALAFGIFGAILGLMLGAVGGLSRRSASALSTGSVAGLVIGAIGGALAAYGLTPFFTRFYSDADPSVMLPLLVRGGICSVVGLISGLAFGLARHGQRGILRSLLGGLLGAAVGIVLFEVVSALAFPQDRNDNPIPSSAWARLVLYLLAAAGAAVGTILAEGKARDPGPAIRNSMG